MIRAVVIDDEVKSVLLVKKLLADYCPQVHVVGEAGNITDGEKVIHAKQPELVFLDIEMGSGDGFGLLQQFDSPFFHVIFITAHSRYAVKAFKFSAVDYVLKPIDIDDLVNAVKKAEEIISKNDFGKTDKGFLQVRTGKGIVYVKPQDITRIEAEASYSRLFLNDGRIIVVALNLGAIEDRLDKNIFLRIHKSAIINISYLKSFNVSSSPYVEMKDGSTVPVSRRSKAVLINHLKEPDK